MKRSDFPGTDAELQQRLLVAIEHRDAMTLDYFGVSTGDFRAITCNAEAMARERLVDYQLCFRSLMMQHLQDLWGPV
jgi:hypothetical protein